MNGRADVLFWKGNLIYNSGVYTNYGEEAVLESKTALLDRLVGPSSVTAANNPSGVLYQ